MFPPAVKVSFKLIAIDGLVRYFEGILESAWHVPDIVNGKAQISDLRGRSGRCSAKQIATDAAASSERSALMATALRLAFIFWMVSSFLYFMTAGANVLTAPNLRDNSAMLGQISFLSGMLCVLFMGLFYGLWVPPALRGAILTLGSLMLYESGPPHSIDRNFYVGLSGEVPAAVCDVGPYRFLRHPLYLSYMTAFLGVAVAFLSLIVVEVCVLNIVSFAYMAVDDERALLGSALSADYKRYKTRVGMFLPRLAGKR